MYNGCTTEPSSDQHLFFPLKKQVRIILTSITSGILSNLIVSPFEVVKIRQQKECALLENRRFNCKSFLHTTRYIVKNEGYLTLYNGLRYTLQITIVANFFRFLIYENSKDYLVAKFNQLSITQISFLSSFISNVVTTTFAFPLDYWKTKQQSSTGICKKRGFSLGKNLFSAYWMTI